MKEISKHKHINLTFHILRHISPGLAWYFCECMASQNWGYLGHSLAVDLDNLIGKNIFAENYIYPNKMSAATFQKYMARFEILFAIKQNTRTHKITGEDSAVAEKVWWQLFSARRQHSINCLNDELVRLNPQLKGIPRQRDNIEFERHFYRGVAYRYPPDDIELFAANASDHKGRDRMLHQQHTRQRDLILGEFSQILGKSTKDIGWCWSETTLLKAQKFLRQLKNQNNALSTLDF